MNQARELNSPTSSHRKRNVQIHLTPAAPDMGQVDISDPVRWIDFWTTTPQSALYRLCRHHLNRSANQVGLRQLAAGDIAVIDQTAEFRGVPLAYIFKGMTLDEAVLALEDVRRGVYS